MCGIVGYIGSRQCRALLIDGLKKLEYRGYDSSGLACLDGFSLKVAKTLGSADFLDLVSKKNACDGYVGIGHTRWATHGMAEERNAHPHLDCDGKIAVIHNGIIDGYERLKKDLILKGHEFSSETDTEIISHMLEDLLKTNKKRDAVFKLAKLINGAFAIVILVNFNDANSNKSDNELFLIRKKSPLVIGFGDGENFVSSDQISFPENVKKLIFLPEGSLTILKKDKAEIFDFDGNAIVVEKKIVDNKLKNISKSGFKHYMLKEIYDQSRAIKDTILSLSEEIDLWGMLGLTPSSIKKIKKINLVAAGTSWHACRIAQFFFEIVPKIQTTVHLASEFRYMPFFAEKDSLFIFVSQSGETADTLEALRFVKSLGFNTLSLTNVDSSTIVRESTGTLKMCAGPEISVASTKAFSTQLISLFWFANRLAFELGIIDLKDMKASESQIIDASKTLHDSMENYKDHIVDELAPIYCKYDKFIFLGKNISYPFAMEAALKLKEISYIFAQCYPAGELKHGPIALIDDKIPVVLFSVLDDFIYPKIVSSAQEVKARNGKLIVFGFESQMELLDLSDHSFVFPVIPKLLAPIAMAGVMQLFIYEITHCLGLPIDKPRNLAKSVTVE